MIVRYIYVQKVDIDKIILVIVINFEINKYIIEAFLYIYWRPLKLTLNNHFLAPAAGQILPIRKLSKTRRHHLYN